MKLQLTWTPPKPEKSLSFRLSFLFSRFSFNIIGKFGTDWLNALGSVFKILYKGSWSNFPRLILASTGLPWYINNIFNPRYSPPEAESALVTFLTPSYYRGPLRLK